MRFSKPTVRLTGFLVALAIGWLDQWSKAAVAALAGSLPQDVTPFMSITLVHNHGISFGLLSGMPQLGSWLLTLFLSTIAVGLAVWLLRARFMSVAVLLGLIIGGAVGNIIDRLRLGSVTDFLDFHLFGHHWPAFNIADSAICIGVVILVLISIVSPATVEEETK